ncbi:MULTISPECIES: PDC sensor domain-containing protein [Chromobacterium]|uniref:hypothetical protein n=1 Tax=Chromobacterium TaxID=535 RepID=UPI0013752757|nr:MULTISPECIES: hypothetical protein [Chromobacterium]
MPRMLPSLPDSFRLRLTALFGALFLATALLAALSLDHMLSSRIVQNQGEAMHALADNIAKAIAANLQERYREVVLLAQTPAYVRAPLDSDDLRKSLERTKRAYRYYAWIGIADPEGNIVSATSGMLQGQSAAKRPWFIHGRHAPLSATYTRQCYWPSSFPPPLATESRCALSTSPPRFTTPRASFAAFWPRTRSGLGGRNVTRTAACQKIATSLHHRPAQQYAVAVRSNREGARVRAADRRAGLPPRSLARRRRLFV